MNDNIQIINKLGEGINTEGIAYIEIPSTTKKYVFYTLNEKVDNDLTKIYIAEVNPESSVENQISETEWDDLRKKMIKISHKETVEDVNFLSMSDVKFNVGDPKKLAITAVAKQAFKDAQISNTMATNQTETPVTSGSSPFFNQEVVGTETNQVATPAAEPSIFANPPQPEITTSPTTQGDTNISAMPVAEASTQALEQTSQVEEPAVPSIESLNPVGQSQPPVENIPTQQIITPDSSVLEQVSQVEEPAIPSIESLNPIGQSQLPVEVSPTPVENTQQAAIPDPNTFNIPTMSESSTAVEQVQEIPSEPDSQVPADKLESVISSNRPIITDEEALKAINIIQEYINQESENNNQ